MVRIIFAIFEYNHKNMDLEFLSIEFLNNSIISSFDWKVEEILNNKRKEFELNKDAMSPMSLMKKSLVLILGLKEIERPTILTKKNHLTN